MNWLRRHRYFAISLLVVCLCVLGEAGLLAERWTAARAARTRLDQAKRELRALRDLRPAPSEENAALIQADVLRMTQALAALRAELAPPTEGAGKVLHSPVPLHRSEAFFDLAAFVEAMRTQAQQAGVVLRPGERFGFSSYAHEAPETEQVAAVARERRIVQFLLEALVEAQPHQLLSVQRSRPPGKSVGSVTVNRVGSAREASGGAVPDYFDLDPRISLRVPGLVETTAIRLTFTGHTHTLRVLLTKLAEPDLPVVVRAVEVVPAELPAHGPGPGQGLAPPLVASAWSRFTVTVEFIALAPQPAAVS